MKRVFGLVILASVVAFMSSDATAQMRGLGKFGGKVTDDAGTPLAGVTIKAALPGNSVTIDSSSDDSGAWVLAGLAKGEWDVTFEKPGYAPRKAKVTLPVELARVPPITVAMKKGS